MITSVSPVTENYQKIRIDDYVRQARISLKKAIVEAQMDINGYRLNTCLSNTRFGGFRLWFECPVCNKRKGVLYLDYQNLILKCRMCLGSQ